MAAADPERAQSRSDVPNEVNGVNTDGRFELDWKSRYDADAVCAIRIDAAYIGVLMVLAFAGIFLTWRGLAHEWLLSGCSTCSPKTFSKFALYFLGGLLGGVLFGIKYLYKVVARSRWHLDRRLWRMFSPFLSAGLALIVGALLESGVVGITTKIASGAAYLSYGFITGYFADRAIDKLQEVAETIFGAPGRKDPQKGN